MGVPALFRWLSQKYPKIVSPVIEEQPLEIDGEKIPMDIRGSNPNGEEFDNLYLDMNGIVHPCSHPEDKPAPSTEEEMMIEIFKYTDRVVNMVRPRKLLMIAVDGVAPRAKMNQQRSRRFRSAQEAKEKDEDAAEFAKMLKSQGTNTTTDLEKLVKKTWDSNAITPGTPFMHLLALSLRYWCAYKINTDPGWEKIKVIISDASVPGEGEHKIMEFIRSQRRSPDHDPNTRHVIYGLDADLIMLGLATHEPHFRVLREDVFFQESKARTCRICGQTGHKAEECRGEAKKKQGEFDEKQKATSLKPFIWLHVSILREYLGAELYVPEQTFKFDLERALDDWVFMCFFVGNDFLPHLPSLDIREQGIDTLINIWREAVTVTGGYVTKDGHVDMDKAQYILSGLAKQEDSIFKRRKEVDDRKEAAAKRRKLEQDRRNGNRYSTGGEGEGRGRPDQDVPAALNHEAIVNRKAMIQQANSANKSAAAVLKEKLRGGLGAQNTESSTEDGDTTDATQTPLSGLGKRKADALEEDSATLGQSTPDPTSTPKPNANEPHPDTVRLWEDGYGDRYYAQKFHVDPNDMEFRHKVARSYVEGLCWVLLYYFQGCPSWTWYYPYHYAPFAADFVDLGSMKIEFEKGEPFHPYEQLMGVLPAASNHAIPVPFRELMSNKDSDIVDFYPEDFELDLNGKKFAWQGVALLPFIDANRLLAAMATKYHLLTEDEKERNEFGKETLIFSTKHPLYDDVVTTFYGKKQQDTPEYQLNARLSEGLSGKIEKNENYLPQSPLIFPIAGGGMPDLAEDESISVNYEMPHSNSIHKSMLLRGLVFPPPALDRGDIEATRNRAARGGHNNFHSNHNRRGGRFENGNYSDMMAPRHKPPRRNNGGSSGYNPENPFAAHLNPNFDPNVTGRAPPPPHMAAANGWLPPPPPGMGGFPPPPPPRGNGQYPPSGRGGYGSSNGHHNSYRGGRHGDRHSGGGNRGYDRY